MNQTESFKPFQVVTCDLTRLSQDIRDEMVITHGTTYLWLGEICNMEGHCAVADFSGRVIWALHTEDFRHPTDDEL